MRSQKQQPELPFDNNLPIEQKNWKKVRFGDVVSNVDISERNPLEKGLEHYVGLEHIEPESLHIKRWGLIKDGTSFTRKFVKGQVLFGKRRAYQGKVAFAEFDGICSGDILVFEAKKESLIPELLPFIVQSKGFYDYALDTSAGSLSPRTKWKDLSAYEFALPPKDEQRRIADILWAADEAIEIYNILIEKLTLFISMFFETAITDESFQKVQLGDVLVDIQYGSSQPSGAKEDQAVPILRIPNVLRGILDLSDLSWVVLSEEERKRYLVNKGDILLVRTNGNPSYVARSVVIEEVFPNTVFASYLIKLCVDSTKILPEYLNELLNSNYLRKTLVHEIRSSAGNYNINTQGLKRQLIPMPNLYTQNNIVEKISKVKDVDQKLTEQFRKTQALKKALLNTFLAHK